MLKKLSDVWTKLSGANNVSDNAIVWAYRLFLDRDPENIAVVSEKKWRLRTTREIRLDFLGSEEFKHNNHALYHLSMSGNEPPLRIEHTSDLQVVFAHIKAVWEKLGENEPHWSVLTSDKFKAERITETKDDFYASGKDNVETFFATLRRNGINPESYKTCVEYGCGVGRVTSALAKKFTKVTAYDISSSHLKIAKEYMRSHNLSNVEFVLLHSPEQIAFPKTDAIYSVIVLQHNPLPIIRLIVQAMLKALNPGGVAFFQVPTYRLDYNFSLSDYLSHDMQKDDMEMHVFPQHEVFRIADEEECKIIEVLEDGWAGLNSGERSNTFLIQKR